jgi:hypothetical protein
MQATDDHIQVATSPQLGLGGLRVQQIRGKPGFLALIQANELAVRDIAIEMEELMDRCRIDGVAISLIASRNTKAKTLHLRWRYRNRHCTWDSLEQVREGLTAPIRLHFERIQKRVLELNSLALIAQMAINRCEHQIGKRVTTRARPKQW